MTTGKANPNPTKKKAPRRAAGQDEPALFVGVGSSAGGLQALKSLISGLNPAARACVVVAQHVAPTHQSLLAELLAPKTELKVRYLEKPAQPRANEVWIVPPNFEVLMDGGQITPARSAGGGSRGPRPSIDRLFHGLATNFGDRSVAIVLSGTGSDGSAGAATVKSAGGMVLVQDPDSAQFDTMPNAVIQTGHYDAILSPEQIGEALVRIAAALDEPHDAIAAAAALPRQEAEQIRALVRKRTGMNLDHYKSSTVMRRVRRRMQLAGCTDLTQYLEYLTGDGDEAARLAGDLSVRVTSFFRDPANFKVLREALDERVRALEPGEVLRAWVPGCATGEEAYSLAILLMEAFRDARTLPSFLVFVSDIHPEAIATARAGRYPEAALDALAKPLRDRYFEIQDGIGEVSKTVRQYMIFASQNVVEDPPFSKLDLVSCRNLLIYFEIPTQKHVMAAFHYALKPEGLLFLGASESVEIQRDLFDNVDARARLFKRRMHPVVYQYQRTRGGDPDAAAKSERRPARGREGSSRKIVLERTRDLIAEHYAPPAIVIDESDHIVHFMGDLSHFVTLPRGPTNWTAHQLVMAPLNAEMRALLHRCRKERNTIRGGNYTMDINGQIRRVCLVAHPDVHDGEVLVMLAFESRVVDAETLGEGSTESISLIRELESELANTREHLQTLVEEVETSNEELQTVNEELQSSNEELQSTNEEMQTSNEELQSTNEELLTVNEELASKTDELESSRADLINIKEALDVGIIAVDDKLQVTQYNLAAAMVVEEGGLRRGVPMGSLSWSIPAEGLPAEVLTVIARKERAVSNVTTVDGRTLRSSIVPYQGAGQATGSGAVLSFLDITAEVTSERQRREQEELYRTMLEASRSVAFLTDDQGVIGECNPAALEVTGLDREALIGRNVQSLFDRQSRASLQSHLRSILSTPASSATFDALVRRQGTDPRWMSVTVSSVAAQAHAVRIVVLMHDIDTLKRRQERLAAEQSQLRFLNHVSRHVLDMESIGEAREATIADLSILFGDLHLSFLLHLPAGLVPVLRAEPGGVVHCVDGAVPKAVPAPLLRRLRNADSAAHDGQGRLINAVAGQQLSAKALDVPVSNGSELVGVIRLEADEERIWTDGDLDLLRALSDIFSVAERDADSRQKRAEAFQRMREQREHVEITLRSISDGVITTDVEGQIISVNPPAAELCGVDAAKTRGKSLFSVYRVVRGEHQVHVPSVVERCLHEGHPVQDSSLDLYLLRPDGKQVPINHSAAPIMDSNGHTIGAVLVFRDVTDTRLLARELSYRAAHDPLTDLPNRDEFERRAELALKEVQGGHARHAVVAIDLDRFKPINDEHGHAAGDAFLRKVAEVGSAELRESDTLARVGGDEFAVLLQNCGPERAMQIAEGLVKAVGDIRLEWSGQTLAAGASAGVVMMRPTSSELSLVLDAADAACYRAKRNGRGRAELSDVDASGIDSEAASLALVREALDQDRCEIVVHEAQVLHAPSGGLPAYRELLMRLRGMGDSVHRPEGFILAARRHNLIRALDQLAMRHSLDRIAADGDAHALYGLNLFPESISDPKLLPALSRLVQERGLSAAQICLEIPESAIASNLDQISRFRDAASEAGFLLAMDQFGSHLDSFAAIRSLQLDLVKINLRAQDFSFGRAAPPEEPVLEALIHICQRGGIRTIAVGVETAEQRERLRGLGVDYMQGSIDAPVP